MEALETELLLRADSTLTGSHVGMCLRIPETAFEDLNNAAVAVVPALPPKRLYRPICAQFSADARRVAQDPAGPFCTMKVRLARDFCDNWSLNLRGLPRRRFLGTLR